MKAHNFTATARNSRESANAGNTSSITGISTREEAIKFFEDSGYSFGTLELGDETVAVWGRDLGLFDVNLEVEVPSELAEPVIPMERTASVRISRFGAAIQVLDRESPEPIEQVDYAAMTDGELKAYILGKMQTSNEWLRKAVVAIFERQTLDEKQTGETKHHNGVGFNGTDARFLGSIAEQMIAGRRSLSQRQLDATRKAMFKYAGQLARIVREKHPRRK